MIGGLLRTTSLAALLAIAGSVGGITTANAADLGGDCCADLEERVAELEATTARKGNRKVSLTVSGWVNEAVLFWDDGFESNAYQVTNMVSQSRFRFTGSAQISADWSAGYIIELGVAGARSDAVTADSDDGTSGANGVAVRNSAWYLQSKTLGKLTVGQFSSATDGLLDAHVANIAHFAGENGAGMVGNFRLRTAAGGNGPRLRELMGGGSTDSAQIGEGNRMNVVRYDTPSLAGFTLSASWGEDDMWDAALRYAGEFAGFKLMASVGYQEWRDGNNISLVAPVNTEERNCLLPIGAGADQDCQQLGAFGAIMHTPTGLFVEGGYGVRWDNNASSALFEKDSSTQWFIIGGIEQKFMPVGKTTIFGEYQDWDIGTTPQIFRGDMQAWGIGINQQIDAAAMDLYIHYRNYDASAANGVAVIDFEQFHQLMAGGRIQF